MYTIQINFFQPEGDTLSFPQNNGARRRHPPLFPLEMMGVPYASPSEAYLRPLLDRGVEISMDGKGRWIDNRFIERLWRSLKYESVYLEELTGGHHARRVIASWLDHYNHRCPHMALAWRGPPPMYISRIEPRQPWRLRRDFFSTRPLAALRSLRSLRTAKGRKWRSKQNVREMEEKELEMRAFNHGKTTLTLPSNKLSRRARPPHLTDFGPSTYKVSMWK